MRYLLLTLILITPLLGFAAFYQARFDWSNGQPAVVQDNTTTCTTASKIRFDWSLGQPTQVLDTTATCSVAGGEDTFNIVLYIRDGDLRIKDGDVRVKQ